MTTQRYIIRVALIATVLLTHPANTTRADESNWPQFRGPGGLGIAPDDQTYPTELDMSRNLLWKTEVPRGHSSPCIWGERIFITARSGKKLETICIDRGNGKIRWRKSVEPEKMERISGSNSHAAPTPVCDGKGVYVYFGSFGLVAYDLEGREIWNKPLPTPKMRHGSAASPVLANNLVILNNDPPQGGYLLAVDKDTGETIWRQERQMDATGWSTPVLWKHGNEQELVVLGGGHLISYDLKGGRKRWWFDNLPSVLGAALTPVYAQDTFFIAVAVATAGDPVNPIELPDFKELIEMYDSDKDNRLIQAEIPEDMALIYRTGPQWLGVKRRFAQLDTDKDGAINEAEWSKAVADIKKVSPTQTDALIAIRGGGRDDVSHSHVQWRVSEGIGQVASPLFYQGRVYLVKHGGNVTCYDAKTGDKLFGNRTGPRVYYFASPVAADNKVYFCSMNGVIIVVQAGDRFDVLAQNKIKGRIYATPALVDGKVYLRTDKHMYAFHHAGQTPLEIAELPKKQGAKEGPSTQVEHAQVKTLHEAASDGDIKLIKSLISGGADVNEQNSWGWTPLYTAVATGHGDIVKLLIAEGADADTPSKAGLTPLHFAVSNGNRNIAELLIKNGADCRTADKNGVTPLHASAEHGHIDVARLLVDNNADIDAKNKWVRTPLFHACWRNHKDLAEFLITKGADMNIKDSRGMTLLHVAGQQDVIELLIAKGIDVNSKNNSGQTPLHLALQRGNKEVIDLLIDTGADINIKNNSGQTPLHLAAQNGLKDIVERLLAKGADVKAQNSNSRTSIGLAKENSHTEIVELLLERANQSGDSKEIMTFYDYTAVGDIEQVKSLVSQGMDVNAKTQAGTIGLHFAVRNGHRDIVEYFISQGADTDTKSNNGDTPLLLATGHKDIAELLIAKGADINTKNNYGQTPLHLAARNGQKDVVELLIAKGADVNAKDRWKWTPLKWAEYGGQGEIGNLLRKHGAEE